MSTGSNNNASTADTSSPSPPNFQCHETHKEYGHYPAMATFWIEGVAILVVGVFGVAGNILTVFVLLPG